MGGGIRGGKGGSKAPRPSEKITLETAYPGATLAGELGAERRLPELAKLKESKRRFEEGHRRAVEFEFHRSFEQFEQFHSGRPGERGLVKYFSSPEFSPVTPEKFLSSKPGPERFAPEMLWQLVLESPVLLGATVTKALGQMEKEIVDDLKSAASTMAEKVFLDPMLYIRDFLYVPDFFLKQGAAADVANPKVEELVKRGFDPLEARKFLEKFDEGAPLANSHYDLPGQFYDRQTIHSLPAKEPGQALELSRYSSKIVWNRKKHYWQLRTDYDHLPKRDRDPEAHYWLIQHGESAPNSASGWGIPLYADTTLSTEMRSKFIPELVVVVDIFLHKDRATGHEHVVVTEKFSRENPGLRGPLPPW